MLPDVVRLVSDRDSVLPPCRFLQRKFDEGGAAAVGRVLPEVLEALPELMVDPFGGNQTPFLQSRLDERMYMAADVHMRFTR